MGVLPRETLPSDKESSTQESLADKQDFSTLITCLARVTTRGKTRGKIFHFVLVYVSTLTRGLTEFSRRQSGPETWTNEHDKHEDTADYGLQAHADHFVITGDQESPRIAQLIGFVWQAGPRQVRRVSRHQRRLEKAWEEKRSQMSLK